MAKKYECQNSACSLGGIENPGRFTGGISKEQLNALTGRPVDDMKSGADYGPGFCPNCGQKGAEI